MDSIHVCFQHNQHSDTRTQRYAFLTWLTLCPECSYYITSQNNDKYGVVYLRTNTHTVCKNNRWYCTHLRCSYSYTYTLHNTGVVLSFRDYRNLRAVVSPSIALRMDFAIIKRGRPLTQQFIGIVLNHDQILSQWVCLSTAHLKLID